jgi:hypothetical protein
VHDLQGLMAFPRPVHCRRGQGHRTKGRTPHQAFLGEVAAARETEEAK